MIKIIQIITAVFLLLQPTANATERVVIAPLSSTVEGTLVQVSKLPPPANNPYPDCYYTAVLEIDHISSGRPIGHKIVLVLPGFFARQYAPEAKFKVGDKVRATLVPFSSTPEKVRQTQQADEVEDVDLQFFFPEKVSSISEFKKSAKVQHFVNGTGKTTETSKRVVEIDSAAKLARREAISQDLQEINQALANHGGDWERWYESLKSFREQYRKQTDSKAQKWVGDSFFSAGYVADPKVYNPSFIKSAIAFKKYLDKRNVDLILVRVPYKGEIVDDLFAPAPTDGITNPYLLKMYKELLEADVEIIAGIIPRAKEVRLKYPLMYWYSDFQERHPAEGIAWVVAKEMAKRVDRYAKVRKEAKKVFKLVDLSTSLDSDSWLWGVEKCNPFWPPGNPRFNPNEYIHFSAVATEDGKPLLRKGGTSSPILITGSSFTDYPSYKHGANIPTYVAYLTGVEPDTLYRAGADASIPRILAREGDNFLKNRIVLLFPMVPMAFEGAMDLPPLVDPVQADRVLLASLSKNLLRENIRLAPKTLQDYFSYTSEGNLELHALSKQSRVAVTLEISLPPEISNYPYFMIEINSRPGDGAVIQAKYEDVENSIHKSYSQKNKDDSFFFKTGRTATITFDISNIRSDFPTIIQELKIYGLNKEQN